MSIKSSANAASRWALLLLGGVKRLASALYERASVDAGLGLIFSLALSLMLLRYERPQITPLRAGAVADSDILAPADLQVEDTSETARRRQQAAGAIPPVFDFLPRASREARTSIEQAFATGRESAPGSQPEQLMQAIQQSSGLLVDKDELQVLVKHRFNAELERLMLDHLDAVTMNGVVSNRSQLIRLGTPSIIMRDRSSEREVTLTSLSSIRDLITARAALRSDQVVWPVDYDLRERRLLGEILGSLIFPNLIYNETETEARRAAAAGVVPPVVLAVEKGKPIVVQGETVTPIKAEILRAAASHHPIWQRTIEFAGTAMIVMLLLLVLWQYMNRYQQRHMRVRRHFLLQASVFIITLALTRLFFTAAEITSQWATNVPFTSQQAYRYLAPLAVGAALVTLMTDAHAAFVFSAILSVFLGVLSGDVYIAAYTLVCGVGAIYHLKGCRDRTALVRAGIWIGLVNATGALALDLLGASEIDLRVQLFHVACAFMGGMIATMVATALLPLFEWVFEIATDIKLLELSNLNLPLLKQLAETAPGTYHHSIMVGLLAEAAAEAIGADALFARVACYYHDIGKVVRPTYFVENQTYMDNRHDKLSPKMSSIVLANHVKQGVELARQYKVPSRIISIIPQHHGTGLMKYFYYKAREEAGTGASAALEKEFRYPGPKPQTREAAIIMMADSVEAAARTVKEPTPAKLANMIETIIARIRDDGQLDECNITMRDLRIVAESFVKVLAGIHHHRIAYPGYDFDRMGTYADGYLQRPGPEIARAAEARGVGHD